MNSAQAQYAPFTPPKADKAPFTPPSGPTGPQSHTTTTAQVVQSQSSLPFTGANLGEVALLGIAFFLVGVAMYVRSKKSA